MPETLMPETVMPEPLSCRAARRAPLPVSARRSW